MSQNDPPPPQCLGKPLNVYTPAEGSTYYVGGQINFTFWGGQNVVEDTKCNWTIFLISADGGWTTKENHTVIGTNPATANTTNTDTVEKEVAFPGVGADGTSWMQDDSCGNTGVMFSGQVPADIDATSPRLFWAQVVNTTEPTNPGFWQPSKDFTIRVNSSSTPSATSSSFAPANSSSAAVTTSSTSNTDPITTAPAVHRGLSQGVQAGIGVGVSIPSLLVISLIVYLVFVRQRRVRETPKRESTVCEKAELDGNTGNDKSVVEAGGQELAKPLAEADGEEPVKGVEVPTEPVEMPTDYNDTPGEREVNTFQVNTDEVNTENFIGLFMLITIAASVTMIGQVSWTITVRVAMMMLEDLITVVIADTSLKKEMTTRAHAHTRSAEVSLMKNY
ncbi:hypothetical protein HD806DRAFT_545961 [Xylariaceae sp. AK1471]|nr:hypothetical protein HD806DRAFT_545961 [Xylariaceae sp. AK1471]